MSEAGESKPMAIGHAALLTFAAQIAQLAAGTINGILVARLLGPAGKGVVALVMLSGSLAVTFGGLGVGMYYGCVAGRGQFSRAALRSNAILCAALGTFLMTGLGLSLWCAGVLPVTGAELAWVLAPVPFGLVMRNFAGIFQGEGRFGQYNAVLTAMWLVIPLATLSLGLTMGGVSAALAAWCLGHVVAALLASWLLRGAGVASMDLRLLRSALAFGVAVWSVQLVGETNLRFDNYVAALVGGAEGAGYYSVAVSITNLLFHLPAAIGTGALPHLAMASGEEAARLTGMGCRISLWTSAGFALIAALLARPMIRLLFGAEFEPAVVPLLWLLPGVVAYALAHVTTSYFYGQAGRPMLNGLVALISLVLGLAACAVLAPRFGLAGVAAGVSSGRIIAIAVNLWLFTRLSRCSLAEVLLPRASDLALVLAPLRRLWLEEKSA
ncbi:MAG: oligosaccharide flippase family protein [Deltaproteobacteria bacterium]|nr:oligosaccharide flippase family protein [Deltaproteobacteria bacterium]